MLALDEVVEMAPYLHMCFSDGFSGQPLIYNQHLRECVPIVGLISTRNGQPYPQSAQETSPTIFLLHCFLEKPRCQMSKRIHRDNLFLVCPLWEGTNICRWLCICKIRSATGQLSFWENNFPSNDFLRPPGEQERHHTCGLF